MYIITKRFAFEASHQLDHLPSSHKCSNLHGHSYRVELVLESAELNEDGFVRDYGELAPFKDFVDEKLDHRNLNDVVPGVTSAENLSRWLYDFASSLWPEGAGVRGSETQKPWCE